MKIEDLKREFAKSNVHWRAQTIRNGRALALAYIDARHVMNRLDETCGPQGWQDEYVIAGTRTLCRIGIKVGDEWVWKMDGAGDTQVEGEKGAISDAFKRAAVKWGIGRYLYDIPAPWVPCETRKGRDGKEMFSKFKSDPWDFVKANPEPVFGGPYKKTELKDKLRQFDQEMRDVTDDNTWAGLLKAYGPALEQCKRDQPSWWYGTDGGDVLGMEDRINNKTQELVRAMREEPYNPLAAG